MNLLSDKFVLALIALSCIMAFAAMMVSLLMLPLPLSILSYILIFVIFVTFNLWLRSKV